MELSDLNQDERTAVVGLMKLVVMADGNVSEDELEGVETLVDAFGEDDYQKTLDAFEARFGDAKSFQTFLRTIKREDARDLIFATVLEAAETEVIEGEEAELLDWLAKAWNIEIEVPEGEDEEVS